MRLRGREAPTHTYRTISSVGVENGSASLARRLTEVARSVTDLPQHGGHHKD
jgi:hypothetical protein